MLHQMLSGTVSNTIRTRPVGTASQWSEDCSLLSSACAIWFTRGRGSSAKTELRWFPVWLMGLNNLHGWQKNHNQSADYR